MRFYRDCVRRQLYLNGPEKIHLSKNPTFAGRVEALIETFPDARIIVPIRNPYDTIPSLLKLMQVGWSLRGWDDAEMNRSLGVLAAQSYHTYQYPLAVLARHPETRRAIVDYRELVAEPRRTIEKVYADLALPLTPEFTAVLEAEQRRARAHETSNRYSLEEFGLRADAIREAMPELFAEYRWDES
jgi:omega-hydroxy-beta-dihydromenaquinone-9 sulfotransferase